MPCSGIATFWSFLEQQQSWDVQIAPRRAVLLSQCLSSKIAVFYLLVKLSSLHKSINFLLIFPSYFFPPLLLIGRIFSPLDRKLHLQISTPGGDQI